MSLTIMGLQTAHMERQKEWCPDVQPDLAFRGVELAGEAGEVVEAGMALLVELSIRSGKVSNTIKKLERERHGWRGSRTNKAQLAEELGDLIHTAVLVALTGGINLQTAVVEKFNKTSEANGLSTMLPKDWQDDVYVKPAKRGVDTIADTKAVLDALEDPEIRKYADLCAAIRLMAAEIDDNRKDPGYRVGTYTMKEVFEANNLHNISDLQKVFDAVEDALSKHTF